MTVGDMELVQRFAEDRSEEAFGTLVSRHLDLVYSVALRQARDAHLAAEIAQTVFVILARKAGSLSAQTVLPGWLCQTARYASLQALAARRRQHLREQAALMEASSEDMDSAQAWLQIAPLLETGMAQLSRKEHDALIVRFFQGKSFKETAGALGTTEAGAKMRVNRALEKLRKFFAKRGLSISAAAIAGTVAAHSVQAAPAALAATVAVSVATGTAGTASTFTLIETTLKYMAWTKMKTAAVAGAVALLTIGTATWVRPTSSPPPQSARGSVARYETPEATVQSLIHALQASDHVAFAAACTPERAAKFREQNASKTAEELRQESQAMARTFGKYQIVSRTTVSGAEIHLHIQGEKPPGEDLKFDSNVIARLKKVGNEWKFDGEERSFN